MDGLEIAWGISLIVTLAVVPMALVRLVALGSGGFEASRTMKTSARFAAVVGALGLAALVALSIALLVR